MNKIIHNKDFLPSDHPEVKFGKTGILLANLGTPEGYDYFSLRKYLSQFLSDQRVIDYPKWLWQPLLQLIILSKRPFTSGKAYKEIWNHEANESPLLTYTREQKQALEDLIEANLGEQCIIDYCMRYGQPSVASKVDLLVEKGCTQLLFFPLYPQYSATTTATACDDLWRHLLKIRRQPSVRVVAPYFDDPLNIATLSQSIRLAFKELDSRPDTLLLSFHGLPKRYLLEGDPYHCHCQKTARLVRESLGKDFVPIQVSFQSRFGTEEWLQPYTVEEVARLAKSGVRHLAVAAPGFASDCIETLEEISGEIKESFIEAGGQRFDYIPALNASELHIIMLYKIILNNLSGWVETH